MAQILSTGVKIDSAELSVQSGPSALYLRIFSVQMAFVLLTKPNAQILQTVVLSMLHLDVTIQQNVYLIFLSVQIKLHLTRP